MADSGEQSILEKPFAVDIAKQGRAACKKCKQKCEQGEMRLAKITLSPYGSGFMKQWHHVDCFFEASMKQRATTNRLKSPEDDLEGWSDINDDFKKILIEKINDCEKEFSAKHNLGFKPIDFVSGGKKRCNNDVAGPSKVKKQRTADDAKAVNSKTSTSTFRAFRKLIADITNVGSYLEKTAHVQKLFSKKDFNGDIGLWCRLLLPGVVKRIYNLQSKQLIKLFSRIFKANHEEMLEDLEQGDVAETISKYFEENKSVRPSKTSTITLEDVDEFLEKLSSLTLEEEQENHFKGFSKRCTANDLKYVIRLVKHDLRMNAGAKHILEGVHPKAYESYQACRDLQQVIDTCLFGVVSKSVGISVMTPILPMLAEACKSVEQAMKKCPNGMYSEIKYDGERVQLHKQGNDFKYFSRSLKPVLPHKISHFKDYIPKAFPHGNDLILDSEILMVDTKTGKPLPFGSLGKHKKHEFKDATVCLFVFDCIYYNGEVLSHKPLKLRKKILQDNMVEIKNHIMFSEMQEIHKSVDLTMMIAKVLKLGLEGLVLKDINSIYEPGKRHWLKVKKDYLFDGAMADTADLIVLGAFYGTGKKGGMMSVFLMGCYDPFTKKFKTVTKVHTGHDDKTLERLQNELDMIKISKDYDKIPKWLECTRTMVPDFVAKDPKNQPVWEITGAEFTQVYEVHTADGISIRFPRVSRIRDDKNWETATNLQELNHLYKESKNADVGLLLKGVDSTERYSDDDNKNSDSDDSSPAPKRKKVPSDNENSDTDVSKKSRDSEASSAQLVKNTKIVKLENPLPNYFKDVCLLVENETLKLYKNLLRHFVAYSGEIVSENDYLTANYVLHTTDTAEDMFMIPCAKTARHINADWIRDTIKNKSPVDWKKYAIVLTKLED